MARFWKNSFDLKCVSIFSAAFIRSFFILTRIEPNSATGAIALRTPFPAPLG
jgi:hypothetical protein